jgi:hypothetical protein
MKNISCGILIIVFPIMIIISITSAQQNQDLSFQLKKLSPQNVETYLHPMIDGFMLDINSTLYHTAKTQDFLTFNVSIKHVSIVTGDDDKKFNLITPEYIDIRDPNSSGTIRLYRDADYNAVVVGAPTVAGDIQDPRVTINPQSSYYNAYINSHGGNQELFQIPRGYSTPSIPLIIPQVIIGLPFGFEAMVRYLPTITAMEVGDAGKCSFIGYGLRYDIGQWFSFLPVNAAIHYATQTMKFKSERSEDIFSVKGTAYGLELSKSLWIFTIYGGYQRESTSFTLNQLTGNYQTMDGIENLFIIPEQTFNGKNKSRTTLGIGISLLFLNAQAEYNFATTPVFALGLGVTLH